MSPCFVAVTLAGMLASGKPAKDARAYLFIGPSTRISPVVSTPGERPHERSEITIGPIVTFPEEVVRAPCVDREPMRWSSACTPDRDPPRPTEPRRGIFVSDTRRSQRLA